MFLVAPVTPVTPVVPSESLERWCYMFKKYKQMKSDAEKYRQLTENRSHEIVLNNYAGDDLVRLEATRSRNFVVIHNYPDGSMHFSIHGLSSESYQSLDLQRAIEEFFGMKVIERSDSGYFRLKKDYAKTK